MGQGSPVSAHGLASRWAVPGVWAAFLWGFVVASSLAGSHSFDLAMRGTAIVQYPSAIVLFTRAFDAGLLLVSGAAVLAVDFALSRRAVEVPLRLVAGLSMAAGMVGYAAVSPYFVVLVGAGGAILMLDGSPRAAARVGSPRFDPLARAFLLFAGVLALVAGSGAVRWMAAGFDGAPPLHGASWYPSVVSAQLLGAFSPVLPEIVLLFFFSWAVRLGIGSLNTAPWAHDDEGGASRRGMVSAKAPLLLLLVGLALAVFVGAYPYLKAVNPNSVLVGVDVRACYSNVLQGLPVTPPCGNSALSYGTERAGAVSLLAALYGITGSIRTTFEVAPALWGCLLVASTFLFVWEGTGEGFLAGVAAVLTAASMQVVTGIDAGLMADWLGLSLAYLFLAVVLRGMRTRKADYLLPAFAVFAALLYTHPWTWAVTVVVLGTFLALDLVQAAVERRLSGKRLEMALVAALVGVGLAADYVRGFTQAGSGLALSLKTVLPALSLSNAPLVSANLVQTLTTYLGGAQANPLWFVLGAAGVLAIPSLKGRFGKLLFAWVFATSFGVLFVGPPSNLLQSRMIYDIPVQIFAAVGLVAIVDAVHHGIQPGDKVASPRVVAGIFLAAATSLALCFALDYVGFLYL